MSFEAFQRFHRAVEGAGYPAMLVTALTCLFVVAAAVAVLIAVESGVALAVALVSMAPAMLVLGGVVMAALTEEGDS